MKDSNNINTVSPENTVSSNEPTIVKTDVGSIDGQTKCPKCGATDISTNINTGKLRCNFCRFEFDAIQVEGLEKDLSKLSGKVVGSGASDIKKQEDSSDVMTLKCTSCGAEVVIDTSSSTQARCHWCRNFLSINQQIPNGSVPDVVLPFGITKEVARSEIEKFVGKRKFFAHPKFKQEFTTENIMGVYFPYMVVDMNTHAKLVGQGEHLVRTYTRTDNNNHTTTYYDADLYDVEREFDLVIDGLTIESNSERLNNASVTQTNNIINSIMPFDIENCVKYDSNYLRGFTSERRDTNIDELHELVEVQGKDIAKFAANETLKHYDRGVRWDEQDLTVKGEQWKAAYLPVWLYSYQQVNGDKKILHYVAVNARTKETMGSVPIHMPKLLLVSFIVELLGFFIFINLSDFDYNWLFLLIGFVYFFIMYGRYRNSSARHKYETETKTKMDNLRENDNFVKSKKGLTNSRMERANNKTVSNQRNTIANIIKKNIDMQ